VIYVESKIINYLGQLRIYSLLDLVFLLLAVKTTALSFFGIIILHIGFLLFLEENHAHKNRVKFPKYLWILFFIVGTILYPSYCVVGYLIFSYLYTKKNKPYFGAFASVFRGLQNYVLFSGILGFFNIYSIGIGLLFFIRNALGDFRDIVKDKKENTQTLPVILGFKKDYKYLHLIFLLITTTIWWYFSGIYFIWLIVGYIIEIGTYWLTPR